MIEMLPWLVLALALLALLLAAFALWRSYRQPVVAPAVAADADDVRLKRLEHEFTELRRGSQALIKLVRELKEELEQLAQRQQQFEFQDPEAKLYNRAVKLLEQGAGLDEIMEACELPRAEAELLMRIHGRN